MVNQQRKQRLGLIALGGLLLCSACGQEGQSGKQTAQVAVVAKPATVATNFYKRLEGTIAGKPVVMQLSRNGGVYSGTYYYLNASGVALMLSSDSTLADPAQVYMAEYSMSVDDLGDQHAVLRCQWKDNELSGTWISADKRKQYPVSLKEVYPEGSYAFEYLNYNDSIAAVAGKKDGPMADISYTYLVPADKGKAGNWLNIEIKKILMLGDSSDARNVPELVRKNARAYLADYQASMGAELSGEGAEVMASMSYSSSANLSINYNDRGFVIVESGIYDYSGGAHGNYGSILYCLDVYGQQRLQLKDIVTLDSAGLQVLVERYFREQYNIGAGDSLNSILFENKLPANDNFYFNDKALCFLYNPYEVAAYAQGQIFVSIPFKALEAHLVPAFKERMKL